MCSLTIIEGKIQPETVVAENGVAHCPRPDGVGPHGALEQLAEATKDVGVLLPRHSLDKQGEDTDKLKESKS